jgi:hypothetical protein
LIISVEELLKLGARGVLIVLRERGFAVLFSLSNLAVLWVCVLQGFNRNWGFYGRLYLNLSSFISRATEIVSFFYIDANICKASYSE